MTRGHEGTVPYCKYSMIPVHRSLTRRVCKAALLVRYGTELYGMVVMLLAGLPSARLDTLHGESGDATSRRRRLGTPRVISRKTAEMGAANPIPRSVSQISASSEER